MTKAQRAGAGSVPDPLSAGGRVLWVWAAHMLQKNLGSVRNIQLKRQEPYAAGGGADILPEPGARIKIPRPVQPVEGIRVE